ncbi:Rib/alpha-like domain-containing protein [Gardnerella pickettii]|uniref:Rib/alpha-like domain-containing protein n=1 Tax=Gardnerella pickettii TaxID=2914924 RepID=UPI0039EFB85E
MFVAAATIVTMLIVPPAHNAKADQAWWDKSGNGFFTHNGYWVGDAQRDIDLSYPEIETVNDNGRIRRKITWKVTFNANSLALKRMGSSQFNAENIGNQKSDGQAWDGRSYIYVYLPRGIDDSSVHVYREFTKRGLLPGQTNFNWSLQGDEKNPGEFNAGWTRWTYTYADGWKFQNDWNLSLGNLGQGKDPKDQFKDQFDTCEVKKWKEHGDFSRVLTSRENGDTVTAYRWTVSAYLDDSVTVPENLPFIAGFRSDDSDKHKFAIMGPYDTDGDGFPDLWEHAHNTNPDSWDELRYSEPKGAFGRFDDGKDYNAVYGKPYSQKPFMYTGKWVGDSVKGHFEYNKDKNPKPTNPKDYKTEDIPQNGIAYVFTNQKLPDGVRHVWSSNNMQDGDVYLNEFTGEVIYKPRKQDAGKIVTFNIGINYPDPSFYNCKKSQVSVSKKVIFKVKKMSQLYNPVYATKDMYAGEQDFSERPTSDGSYGSIKGPLPEGTTFAIGKYNHGIDPLSWSAIQPQDTKTGSVYFYPNKWLSASKKNDPYKTPVIVTYPDGSKSTDEDSITKGNPVYAKVNLKRHDPGSGDLQLHIHKNQNGQEIKYEDGFVFRKNRDVTPQPWIDSWSKKEPGDITIRSVCADTTNLTNLKFYLNGINGITINGEKPWSHATDEEQEKCRNGQGCAANKLFDSTGDTMERTRGSIAGKPLKVGNYQCTVYALKPKALKKFEDVAKDNKDISSKNGSSKNIIKSDTFNGLRDGIDYTSRTVPIKVHSDAHYYNPQYDKVYVQAGGSSKESAAPVSHSGANSVKADDKSQKDLVQDGTRLPKGTWFELKKYPKDSKNHVLTWYKFVNKQSNKKSGEDKPEDSTSDARYGKVTFSPEGTVTLGEYFAPVIVHYPDGSTSEDPDSGNLGKPVYAPVEVTSQPIQKNDLKLNVYSQYGGRRIEDNDKNGMRFRKDEVLGNATGNTKPMFFDSWSSAKQGKIYQRMLCYKKNPQTGKPESYKIDGINGLTLAGRKGNTTSGEFTDKQPSQWTRATEKNKNECKVHGKNCNRNLYLYGDEHDTVERTWGWLHGKVNENGDFVCTVYAIKDLENKDGKHGNLQNKFDQAVNDFVKKPADRKFEDVIKTVLTDKENKDKPLEATQRHIDWDSVTFPIHVHSDAHYYNPEYKAISMEAGTKKATEVPKSKKNANDANTLQDDVREGNLPDGTWFEFKKSLSYVFFEDDQDNKADSGDSAKNGTGQFGKVTFRPHKWFPVGSDKPQVIVHYPDGSTSEDKDSGNLGKPIYAKVDITRSHDEDAGNLRLNVGDREGSGNWGNTTIKLTKGEELSTPKQTTRWLDSWSKHKPGKINLRTICNKINSDGTKSHYQSGGIAGIKMQDVKIWEHTEDASAQKDCEKDKSACHPDRQLYDDYIANGKSQDTTERTRGWLKGTANETGDYECVVYAIKDKQFKKDNNDLLARFDAVVGALNKNASMNNTDPLKDFKWKLDGDTGKKDAVKGVDYEYRKIPISIHTLAHKYNPVYEKATVQAGNEVQSGLPKNKKPTGDLVNTDSLAYKAIEADDAAFPDGTWFELKQGASSPVKYDDAYDWSFWKNGQNDSNAPRDHNNPLNHNGNDTGIGAGSRYGNVTFHPDVTVVQKDHYKTHVVVHYPDGSTSEDPDAGNNQFKRDAHSVNTMNPVYAPVKVTDLGYRGNDLQMILTKSKDTDSVLNGSSDLTVMSSIGLIRNPFVQAWSVKDKGKIHLRMMCSKDQTDKWSPGLEDTLNMHLGHNYGEKTPEWTFATESQQKDCRENGNCSVDHVLYGMLNANNTQAGSVESATARREEEIEGAPKEPGTYACAVFALKDKALDAFNTVVSNGMSPNTGAYSTTNMWRVSLPNVKQSSDWDRISFKIHVVEPFNLPKTGGEGCVNWNMLMSVVCVLGTGAMAAGFFLDQTKWGRAVWRAAAGACGSAGDSTARAACVAARGASRAAVANRAVGAAACGHAEPAPAIKSFIRKTAEWCGGVMLRIEWWITERWRC